MSSKNTDILMQLWSRVTARHGALALFANYKDMLNTIDSVPLAGVPWQTFEIKYNGLRPGTKASEVPRWKTDPQTIFFRDPRLVVHEMLANPDYNNSFDYAPTRVFNKAGDRQYKDFMSGDWAWEQAVSIRISLTVLV
jgi:hypothetical protein